VYNRTAFDELINQVNLRGQSNYFFSYKNITEFARLLKKAKNHEIPLTDRETEIIREGVDDVDFYPILETEGEYIMTKSVKYLHDLKLIFSRLDFFRDYDFSRIEKFYLEFFNHIREKY
jgi:hypothetical protein